MAVTTRGLLQSPPRPAHELAGPVQLLLFFLYSQAQGRAKPAGPIPSPPALDAGPELRKELSSNPALKLQRTGATPPRRGAPPSLLGLSLGLITHGQRGWGSDSGHGHPHGEEERGGKGGKRGGRQRREEGQATGGGRCTARALLQSTPLFPRGILPSCSFLQPRSPKVFFWCENGHSLSLGNQLSRASL